MRLQPWTGRVIRLIEKNVHFRKTSTYIPDSRHFSENALFNHRLLPDVEKYTETFRFGKFTSS